LKCDIMTRTTFSVLRNPVFLHLGCAQDFPQSAVRMGQKQQAASASGIFYKIGRNPPSIS